MGYGYEYTYDYSGGNSIGDSTFAAVLSIWLIVLMVSFIFWIVQYIFQGIGLYTIAKRMGKKYPWLGFVPFARRYLHGDLAGEIRLKEKSIKNPGIWKLVLPIIAYVGLMVFYIIFLIAITMGILLGAASRNASAGGGIILIIIVLVLIIALAAVLYDAVYKVLCVLIDFQIYEKFTSRNMAVVHAVLSAVIPMYEAFCLYVMRNKEFNPGMEPVLAPPAPAPVPPVSPAVPMMPSADAESVSRTYAETPAAGGPAKEENAAGTAQDNTTATPSCSENAAEDEQKKTE